MGVIWKKQKASFRGKCRKMGLSEVFGRGFGPPTFRLGVERSFYTFRALLCAMMRGNPLFLRSRIHSN